MAEKVERLTYKIQFDAESGTSTIRGLDGTIKATMVSTQKLRQEYGNFATQIKATNAEINNLSGGVNGKGGLNGMSAASGSASAAALELGRVVSDAPYGIRGMANNVSQLASQLFFMASQQEIATVATKSDTVVKTTNTTATVAATTATVGFAGALRMMWTALMGPLGILLALQAVIAAADYFFGGMKKAEEATKDLNKELKSQIDIFRLYDQQLGDANVSLEERLKILKAVSAFDKDLSEKLKAANGDREKETEILKNHLKQKELELAIKKQEVILNDAIAKKKRVDEEINLPEEQLDTKITSRNQGLAGLGMGRSSIIQSDEERKAIKETTEAQDELNEALKIYTDLLSQLDAEEGNGPKNKRIKEFKQNLLDLESEMIAFDKSRLLSEESGEAASRRIRQKFEREDLESLKNQYLRKEQLRHDNYIKELDSIINNGESSAAEIKDANNKKLKADETYLEGKTQAQEEYNSAVIVLDNKHLAENAVANASLLDQKRLHDTEMAYLKAESDSWVREGNIIVQQDLYDANQKKLADDKKYWEDKRDAAEYGGAEYLDAVKKVAQTELNITKNTAERERTIEQAKFDFKMSVMDAAASSFSSLSILAKEGSDLSKALALTGILVDTAAGLMAGLRIAQEQSLLAPPVSTYAFPLFYAAQTAAVLGAAAQAKRIISSGGSGTPSATVASSGSGGGGSTFNPNFNIVGASGSNQLAETVAGQIGEPTRAYVVYDDIATAGEIEANAIEASGI
jgi:hypothetical protein